ncbi:MAG: hypothetical protein PIR53_16640 [Nocardioides alkalitolerans]|jgi:hypothetical protein
MGLSYAFLVWSRTGTVDLSRPAAPEQADAVVRRLFPRTPYARVATHPLLDARIPPREEPSVGVFVDGVLMATRDAHLYDPGILHRRYLKLEDWPDLRLLTSDSTRDMVAYGHWLRGEQVRCLSVNALHVYRDRGAPEGFEGSAPASVDRWLDLSNAALATVLGLDGDVSVHPSRVEWQDVVVHRYARPPR